MKFFLTLRVEKSFLNCAKAALVKRPPWVSSSARNVTSFCKGVFDILSTDSLLGRSCLGFIRFHCLRGHGLWRILLLPRHRDLCQESEEARTKYWIVWMVDLQLLWSSAAAESCQLMDTVYLR